MQVLTREELDCARCWYGYYFKDINMAKESYVLSTR